MARKLKNTKNMPKDEWLELRRHSIGGSDASSVLGYNKWHSAYSLWAEKAGLIEAENIDNEAVRQGHDLEDYVARRFTEATGKNVRNDNFMYLHDDYDFMSANLDRRIVGENAGLECKTTSAFAKSDFENGEIPLYYYCQCMHYMAVMGFDRMYLAVIVLGRGFYHFEIDRDENEISALIKAEKEFWKHVSEKRPVEIDSSDSTSDTLKKLYPKIEEKTAFLGSEVSLLVKIQSEIKELEELEKRHKNAVIEQLSGAERGVNGKYTVIYKPYESTRVDSKKLKEKYPSVYEQVTKISTGRRFIIKEA